MLKTLLKATSAGILVGLVISFLLWVFDLAYPNRTFEVINNPYLESKHKKVLGVVTAYSEIDSCHYKGCPMANGIRAQEGYIACPRDIKLGTIVAIDNQLYECGDRTAKWVDGRWDIFVGYGKEAHKKALVFGKQEKEIIIIKK